MIHMDVSVSTEVRGTRITGVPTLVFSLSGQTASCSVEGELRVHGLLPSQVDEIEDEVVRRLGGHCVLSLGPKEVGSAFSQDPSRGIRSFGQRWGMAVEDWVSVTRLTSATVEKVLTARKSMSIREHTQAAFSSAMSRIVQNPTLGEYLRFRRISSGYKLGDICDRLGVSEEQLYRWEHDLEPVPDYIRESYRSQYGIASLMWTAETSVLGLLAPLTMTTPPPWGSKTRVTEIADGEPVLSKA